MSVITFVVAQTYFAEQQVGFSAHMTFLLAALEVPAPILAAALGKRAQARPGSDDEFTRELLFGKSVLLLIGGMAIGAFAGEQSLTPLSPLFFYLFRGVVCFLLPELGVTSARQMPALKKSGAFLFVFAWGFPLASALAGALLGRALGFGIGDQTLSAVLFASAS